MSQNYTYIIYNSCYGRYLMNRDFVVELFKRHPVHTEIGKKIFKFKQLNNNLDDLDDLDDLETEYFLNYRITNDKIIDIENNKSYYLLENCLNFRSNEYVINYIFERTIIKILKSNDFTPYFYRILFQLDKNKFSTKIQNENELIELENVTQESIYNYSLEIIYNRSRDRRIFNRNIDINIDLTNIKFYKNGFKLINENEYYKFNFDININIDNLYDILYKIDNRTLLYSILFDDINSINTSLAIDKIKNGYIWKILEYDGAESIKLSLPYEDIISDLLNNIWNTESYNLKSNLTQKLINKEKSMKDLLYDIL